MKKGNKCACGFEGRVHGLLVNVESDGVPAIVELMDHLAFEPEDGLDLRRMAALHRWVNPSAVYRLAEYVAYDCRTSIHSARLANALHEVTRILND